jgi:hypothetical protein
MWESKSPLKRIVTEEFKRDAVRLAVERGNISATAPGYLLGDGHSRNGFRSLESCGGEGSARIAWFVGPFFPLRRFATREVARPEVFEYIEISYDRQRRHSTLGFLSPAEF